MAKRLALLLAIAIVGCRAQRGISTNAGLGAAHAVRVDLSRANIRITPSPNDRIVVTGRILHDRQLWTDDVLANAGVEIVQEHGFAILRENAFARKQELSSDSDDRPLLFELDIAVPLVPLSIVQTAGKVTVNGDFPSVHAGLGAGEVNIRTSTRSLGHINAHGAAGAIELRLPHDRERHPLLLGGYTRDLGGDRTIEASVGAGQILVQDAP